MGSYDAILAKLKQAQAGGTLGSLVGHDDAAKFSGELPTDEAGFTAAFGASDLDYLRGLDGGGGGSGGAAGEQSPSPAPAPSVPGPGAPSPGVPGPGGPAPAPGPAPAMQGLSAAIGGGGDVAGSGAGWAADGPSGGNSGRLGQRTPARAMSGLRTAGRLY